MNIIYFLNSYPSIHKIVAHDEIIEMNRRKHFVTVVSIWDGIKNIPDNLPFTVIYLTNKIQIFSITHLLLKHPVKIISHLRILKKYLGFQDAAKYISSYKIFISINPDRIHAHFANNAALKGYLLAKYLNVPFSCTGHGSELLLYPEPYLKELILNSHPFITISQYNIKFLEERYNISPNVIQVNYAGIYLENFRPHPNQKPNIFTILSVTGLIEIKGVKYLIDACRILKKKGLKFICKIIGGGELYTKLYKKIHDLKLENNVFLLGEIENHLLVNYYNGCNVFILPSLSEGIPVAVMEAMAMELPVITSNITGLPEIIEDGINGYLIPPKDPQALAEKIIDLYYNPEKRTAFSKAARQTIIDKFNLKTNVANFESLLTNSGPEDPESSF